MRKLFAVLTLAVALSAPLRVGAQNPFLQYLVSQQMSSVPLVYQSRVVPGAIITRAGTTSSFPGTTTIARGFEVIPGSVEQAQVTLTTKKNHNLLAKIFGLGGGAGFTASDQLDISETTLLCKSIDEDSMDKLVYKDPDFAKKAQPYLTYGTPYLIESVCYATDFSMSEASSRAITAAFNGALPSCDPKASGQSSDKSKQSDSTQNDTKLGSGEGQTSTGSKKISSPSKDKETTAIDKIEKDTIGDLQDSLKAAAKEVEKSIADNASVQVQYCSSIQNKVILKAKYPVAIALKLWKIGPAVNPKEDNVNKLDYQTSVDSYLQ